MDIVKFYLKVIDDEKKKFNVNVSKIISSLNIISGRNTFHLHHNVSAHRCAYLYKYASCDTTVVQQCFQQLMSKHQLEAMLAKANSTLSLHICCLGGGPGTEVVGVIKALADYPKIISKISVLDICEGWQNSFNIVMKKIMEGKLKGVSSDVLNNAKFETEFVEVDFLEPLSTKILNIIGEADIVTMVKFTSVVNGKPSRKATLENIVDNMKDEALLLFLDNFSSDGMQTMDKISHSSSLRYVSGPDCVHYKVKAKSFPGYCKELYKCNPLQNAKLSVAAFLNKKGKEVDKKSVKLPLNNSVMSSLHPSSTEIKSNFEKIGNLSGARDVLLVTINDSFSSSHLDSCSSSIQMSSSDSQTSMKMTPSPTFTKQETNGSDQYQNCRAAESADKSLCTFHDAIKDEFSQGARKIKNIFSQIALGNEASGSNCDALKDRSSPLPASRETNNFNQYEEHSNSRSNVPQSRNLSQNLCDKETEQPPEIEPNASLLSLLERLVSTFENIQSQLGHEHCRCCKMQCDPLSQQAASLTLSANTPVLLLPLQHVQEDRQSEIISLFSGCKSE